MKLIIYSRYSTFKTPLKKYRVKLTTFQICHDSNAHSNKFQLSYSLYGSKHRISILTSNDLQLGNLTLKLNAQHHIFSLMTRKIRPVPCFQLYRSRVIIIFFLIFGILSVSQMIIHVTVMTNHHHKGENNSFNLITLRERELKGEAQCMRRLRSNWTWLFGRESHPIESEFCSQVKIFRHKAPTNS